MENDLLNKNELNIEEGTVTFRVNAGNVNWADSQTIPLFELSNNGNSIFIVKDSDNRLKLFHVFLGKGKTEVEGDVSNFPSSEPHFIVATWSVSKKEVALYVDGKLLNSISIKY